MSCNECDNNVFPSYRVVQSIYERNTIPCIERINGMIVTVVGNDLSYKQYMLKGGDPCVNSNWEEYGLTTDIVKSSVGHETIYDNLNTPSTKITSQYLNTRFPNSIEGFRVTYTKLKTTFMKIHGDVWVMTNNVPIDYE